MAVPKKKKSKAKKNSRKANWKQKSLKVANKSLSLAKSILKGKTTSFRYVLKMTSNGVSNGVNDSDSD